MLGGLVSPEMVCTCISCVLEISLNYPLLIVLYTGDGEFSPNSLVPDIGPSAGQSLEWDSRLVSEVNSLFSLCWELTFLSNLRYFSGWPLAVLCQLGLITWSQACRSARPLKSSGECTRLSSVCQVFLKAVVKLHTLLFVLCTDIVFCMARGLQIGKKQQHPFICSEGWIGETEISGLGQGTSSEEIKCFGSWYLLGGSDSSVAVPELTVCSWRMIWWPACRSGFSRHLHVRHHSVTKRPWTTRALPYCGHGGTLLQRFRILGVLSASKSIQ